MLTYGIVLSEDYAMLKEAEVTKMKKVLPCLNEAQKRLYLASEAEALGRGGISAISEALGVSRMTITTGTKELNEGRYDGVPGEPGQRIRKEGAGRKSIKETQPGITAALESLIEGATLGDPQSLLRWTTKSLRNLEEALKEKGFTVGYRKIGYMLKDMGYSLHLNQKMDQVGSKHPDRNKQFEHINNTAKEYISDGIPVISIDCKKKENIGNFKNGGTEYTPKGDPVHVLDHDFPLPENGKAAPYGVYDIGANEGMVSVGISHDTAQFAVNSIRVWWQEMGKIRYPDATKLLITCDGGGSNGSRNRLWKVELQKFSDETGLKVEVCHFPPGTSKWNKIEHRMFSQITKNWRARPLVSLEVIVNLIASTTTDTGLVVKCKPDMNEYECGIKVTDEELAKVKLSGHDFHPEWNYTVSPKMTN